MFKLSSWNGTIRLVGWMLCGCFALSFRFFWGNSAMADWFTWHVTYGMTWVVFGWFCIEMVRWLKPRLRNWLAGHAIPLLVITIVCGLIHLAEPHFHKVLADEPAHAATALSMHLHKIVTTPMTRHFPYEINPWEYTTAPFRGHFFSFLISLTHDFTGFRPENIYAVNGILGWGSLVILYAIGHRITKLKSVSLAVAIALAGAPIFGQVMCSGSYDLGNLLFLTLLSYFMLRLATGDVTTRFNIRIIMLISVILAYSRPESILYYGVACIIIILFCQRNNHRERALTIEQIIAPLLFTPSLCTQLILLSNPTNLTQFQLDTGKPITSLNYAVKNWTDTFAYFLNIRGMNMSSIFLFSAGFASILLLLVHLAKSWKRNEINRDLRNVLFTFGLISISITGLYSMIMFSFWGGPSVQVMTRFTLPLWFMLSMACLIAVAVAQKQFRLDWLKWSLIPAIGYFMTFTLPTHASGESILSMHAGYVNHKALEWIDKTDDKRTLIVADSAIQYIARKHPAISSKLLNSHPINYVSLLKSNIIGRLVRIELQITNPDDGKSIIHEKNWRQNADQWETKLLWHYDYSLGLRIVAEELIGVTIDGKYHDLSIKDPCLPPAANYFEMRYKAENLVPLLKE